MRRTHGIGGLYAAAAARDQYWQLGENVAKFARRTYFSSLLCFALNWKNLLANTRKVALKILEILKEKWGSEENAELVLAFVFAVIMAAISSSILLSCTKKHRSSRDFKEVAPAPVQIGEITEEELEDYDGCWCSDKPLLVAVKGQIYDVTKDRVLYEPFQPMRAFTGKDATRAFAKGSLESKDVSGDLTGLTVAELERLQRNEDTFMRNYPKVGTLIKKNT